MYGRAGGDNVSHIPVHSDQFCVLEWVLWLQLRHWALLAPPSLWHNTGDSLVITDHIYNKQTTQYYNLPQVKTQFHRQGRFITYYSVLMKVLEIDRRYCESIQHHESNSTTEDSSAQYRKQTFVPHIHVCRLQLYFIFPERQFKSPTEIELAFNW